MIGGAAEMDDKIKVFGFFAVPAAICVYLGRHQDLQALVADAFCVGVIGLVALSLILHVRKRLKNGSFERR
jgi:hypothetical protein